MHLMKGKYDLEIDSKALEDNDSYKQLQERAWRKRAAFPFIRETELSRFGQTAIHFQTENFHQDKSFCSNKARLYNKRFSLCIEKDHYYKIMSICGISKKTNHFRFWPYFPPLILKIA